MTPNRVELAALAVLARGPADAGSVGAVVWPARRGRGSAVQGGGDYAAQMLLGRMRKKGWCAVEVGTGSSQWVIEPAGRRAWLAAVAARPLEVISADHARRSR